QGDEATEEEQVTGDGDSTEEEHATLTAGAKDTKDKHKEGEKVDAQQFGLPLARHIGQAINTQGADADAREDAGGDRGQKDHAWGTEKNNQTKKKKSSKEEKTQKTTEEATEEDDQLDDLSALLAK
ncbi:unnamed protein product, partial [Amoebophrya sp. A25]